MTSEITSLRPQIERLFDQIGNLKSPQDFSSADHQAIESVLDALEKGFVRVAEKSPQGYVIHDWIKKAILLEFRRQPMREMSAGDLHFYDKIPLRRWQPEDGVRVVPHAVVRKGAHIAKNCVLMPSYVNIGAFVGEGSMVDTWATVGSCAQVGRGVHISGGVGLGGVIEPLQASPVIIEDHVFLGSRSIIVEGVIVEEGSVIGAGTVITASTRIIDVTGNEPITLRGKVPKNSVVIPGSTPKTFPAGTYDVPCALIIGKRSAATDQKTSLNQVLREFELPV